MFRLKAKGCIVLPPKIFFHRDGPRFYSSMVSSAPSLGYAGCKRQSGDPQSPARGLSYIHGLIIISEDATGQPVAIMDSKWLTANRTAAAPPWRPSIWRARTLEGLQSSAAGPRVARTWRC